MGGSELTSSMRRRAGVGPGRGLVHASLLGLLLSFGACASGPPRRGTPAPAVADPGWATVPKLDFVPQTGRADCGAAALAMVLGRWGRDSNPESMRARTGPIDDRAGLKAGLLRSIVRAEGLNAYLISGTFDDLAREVERGHPVLVGVLRQVGTRGYPHYVVVTGVNRDQRRVLTADPAEGWKEQPFDDFEARWRFARNLALVAWP
ncbi:MAG TPA: cysteine peptidase family C39 domain-containing protein [Polyangia bacterium]